LLADLAPEQRKQAEADAAAWIERAEPAP